LETQTESHHHTSPKSSIWGILISPYTQFERIKRNPRIWGPLLVVILLSIVFGGIQNMAISQDASLDNVVLEGADQQQLSQFATAFAIIGTVFAGIVGPLFAISIVSLVYWLIVKLFSSDVSFRTLFSLNTHLHLLMVLALGVHALSVWIFGLPIDARVTSLAAVFPVDHGVFRNLLDQVELFSIWKWLLTVGGLAIVAGLSRKQGWMAVLIVIGLNLAMAALFGLAGTLVEEWVPAP
jgi:hypothetical protein